MNRHRLHWHGRSVLVTGHTGFKGSWLALWLHRLGATVHGYALDPPTEPSLFNVARVKTVLASDTRADLADLRSVKLAVQSSRPDVVFHLAAQPLVRESYRDPLRTLSTNVMGTAHLLEAARESPETRAIVVVTTDKVYEDRQSSRSYREGDRLGGRDPYSASKAAAELVAASYRASFFDKHGARVATARAGNVIGGGDWARDRLVPDCLRALESKQPLRLRYPTAVRPWQHALEPLAGYLQLAESLLAERGPDFCRAWNFGPGASGGATVRHVADVTARLWGRDSQLRIELVGDEPRETAALCLDSTSARAELGWHSRWSLDEALGKTVAWHKAWLAGEDMAVVCLAQIAAYENAKRYETV